MSGVELAAQISRVGWDGHRFSGEDRRDGLAPLGVRVREFIDRRTDNRRNRHPTPLGLPRHPLISLLVQEYLQPSLEHTHTVTHVSVTGEAATSTLAYGEIAVLERHAVIRRQLRPPYGAGLIADIDTLIAATALQRDLSLPGCISEGETREDAVANIKEAIQASLMLSGPKRLLSDSASVGWAKIASWS